MILGKPSVLFILMLSAMYIYSGDIVPRGLPLQGSEENLLAATPPKTPPVKVHCVLHSKRSESFIRRSLIQARKQEEITENVQPTEITQQIASMVAANPSHQLFPSSHQEDPDADVLFGIDTPSDDRADKQWFDKDDDESIFEME